MTHTYKTCVTAVLYLVSHVLLLGIQSRLKSSKRMRRELGDTFKWMFYGDDDTFYVVDPALKLLQGLDHNMPYFLTGAI